MDIRELCAQAGMAVKYGGKDEWGHGYEADELRFGFAFRAQVLCFRYQTTEGSCGWFMNFRLPQEKQSSLVFTRVNKANVAQILLLYLASLQYREPEPSSRNPKHKQFLLFGS